jgi:hypothetical protein
MGVNPEAPPQARDLMLPPLRANAQADRRWPWVRPCAVIHCGRGDSPLGFCGVLLRAKPGH